MTAEATAPRTIEGRKLTVILSAKASRQLEDLQYCFTQGFVILSESVRVKCAYTTRLPFQS